MSTDLVQKIAMAKQDDWVRITLRLPNDVHERLLSVVSTGPNSLNAEIVARLSSSFLGNGNTIQSDLNRIASDASRQTAKLLIDALEAASLGSPALNDFREKIRTSEQ